MAGGSIESGFHFDEDDSDNEEDNEYKQDQRRRAQLEKERLSSMHIYERESLSRRSFGVNGLQKPSCLKAESLYEPFEDERLRRLINNNLRSRARRKLRVRNRDAENVKKTVTWSELNIFKTNDYPGGFVHGDEDGNEEKDKYMVIYTKMGCKLKLLAKSLTTWEHLDSLLVEDLKSTSENESALAMIEHLLSEENEPRVRRKDKNGMVTGLWNTPDDEDEDEEDEDEENDLDKVNPLMNMLQEDEEEEEEEDEEENKMEEQELWRKQEALRKIKEEDDRISTVDKVKTLINEGFNMLLEGCEDMAGQDARYMEEYIKAKVHKLNEPLRKLITQPAFVPLFRRYTYLEAALSRLRTKVFGLKPYFRRLVYSPLLGDEMPHHHDNWLNYIKPAILDVLDFMNKFAENAADIDGILNSNGKLMLKPLTKKEQELKTGKIMVQKDLTKRYLDLLTNEYHYADTPSFNSKEHIVVNKDYYPVITFGPDEHDHWLKRFTRWHRYGPFFAHPLRAWRTVQTGFTKLYFTLLNIGIGGAMMNDNRDMLEFFYDYDAPRVMREMHARLHPSYTGTIASLPMSNPLVFEPDLRKGVGKMWGQDTSADALLQSTNAYNGQLNPVVRTDYYYSRRRDDSSCFHGCLGHRGKLINLLIRLGRTNMVEYSLKCGIDVNTPSCSWITSAILWDKTRNADWQSLMKKKGHKLNVDAAVGEVDDVSGDNDHVDEIELKRSEKKSESEEGGQERQHPRRDSPTSLQVKQEPKKNKKKYKGIVEPPVDYPGINDDTKKHIKSVFEPITPLAVAVECAIAKGGKVEMVKLLLDHGANPMDCDGVGLRYCIPVIDAWARSQASGNQRKDPTSNILSFDKDDAICLDMVVRASRRKFNQLPKASEFEGNFATIAVKSHMLYEALMRGNWEAVRFLTPNKEHVIQRSNNMAGNTLYRKKDKDVSDNNTSLSFTPSVATVLHKVVDVLLDTASENSYNTRAHRLNGFWFLLEEFKFYPTDDQMVRVYNIILRSMGGGTYSSCAGEKKAILRLLKNKQIRHFLGLEINTKWPKQRLDQFGFDLEKRHRANSKKKLFTLSLYGHGQGKSGRKMKHLDNHHQSNVPDSGMMQRKLYVAAARAGYEEVLNILQTQEGLLKKKTLEEILRNITREYYQFNLYERIGKLYKDQNGEAVYNVMMKKVLTKCLISSLESKFESKQIVTTVERIKRGEKSKDVLENFFRDECAAYVVHQLLDRGVELGTTPSDMKLYVGYIHDVITFGPFYEQYWLDFNPAAHLSRVFVFKTLVALYLEKTDPNEAVNFIKKLSGNFIAWDEGFVYLIQEAKNMKAEFAEDDSILNQIKDLSPAKNKSIDFNYPIMQINEQTFGTLGGQNVIEEGSEVLYEKFGFSGFSGMSEML